MSSASVAIVQDLFKHRNELKLVMIAAHILRDQITHAIKEYRTTAIEKMLILMQS